MCLSFRTFCYHRPNRSNIALQVSRKEAKFTYFFKVATVQSHVSIERWYVFEFSVAKVALDGFRLRFAAARD